MPAGRPSTYSEDVLTRTFEYIYNYNDHGDVIPTVAGLAIFLGCVKSTCYEWAKTHPKFSNALEQLSQTQEKALLNGAIPGKYNSTITKLVLHNHGYSDKSQTDITSGGEPITGITYVSPHGDQTNSDD